MNNNTILLLLFVFLVLLLLFYYLNIESNIIVLLGVIIILLMNELIVNKDHFVDSKESLDDLLNKVDSTLNNLKKIKQTTEEKEEDEDILYLEVKNSCSPNYNITADKVIDTTKLFDELTPNVNLPNSQKEGVSINLDTVMGLAEINASEKKTASSKE